MKNLKHISRLKRLALVLTLSSIGITANSSVAATQQSSNQQTRILIAYFSIWKMLI